jgi:hypothetical protein
MANREGSDDQYRQVEEIPVLHVGGFSDRGCKPLLQNITEMRECFETAPAKHGD